MWLKIECWLPAATEYYKWTEQLKNPHWQEADQLAMYNHSRGAEPEAT